MGSEIRDNGSGVQLTFFSGVQSNQPPPKDIKELAQGLDFRIKGFKKELDQHIKELDALKPSKIKSFFQKSYQKTTGQNNIQLEDKAAIGEKVIQLDKKIKEVKANIIKLKELKNEAKLLQNSKSRSDENVENLTERSLSYLPSIATKNEAEQALEDLKASATALSQIELPRNPYLRADLHPEKNIIESIKEDLDNKLKEISKEMKKAKNGYEFAKIKDLCKTLKAEKDQLLKDIGQLEQAMKSNVSAWEQLAKKNSGFGKDEYGSIVKFMGIVSRRRNSLQDKTGDLKSYTADLNNLTNELTQLHAGKDPKTTLTARWVGAQQAYDRKLEEAKGKIKGSLIKINEGQKKEMYEKYLNLKPSTHSIEEWETHISGIERLTQDLNDMIAKSRLGLDF